MPAKIFEDLLTKGLDRNKYTDYEVRDWLRYKAGEVKEKPTPQKFMQLANKNQVNKVAIGKLYMFVYDPKHKATLPYYDTFPAIFPIEFYSDGFLGLNMHYLPPLFRARLLDNLYNTLNNENYSNNSKLQISYKILKGVTKFRYFKPTIHRYLSSHVKSKFISVNINEWDYALFLPVAKFKKKAELEIWNESVHQIIGK